MYIMTEEPSASTKTKSFTLKYELTNTSLECEEIALPNTCGDQKCSLHNTNGGASPTLSAPTPSWARPAAPRAATAAATG